jgi:hypothetical protein
MMEYLLLGFVCFSVGMMTGAAFAQKTLKVRCGEVEIEARSVRELKAIVDQFKGENPLSNFKGGPVQ